MNFEGRIAAKEPFALKVKLPKKGQELQQDQELEKSNFTT
jgi:hypothetical protein